MADNARIEAILALSLDSRGVESGFLRLDRQLTKTEKGLIGVDEALKTFGEGTQRRFKNLRADMSIFNKDITDTLYELGQFEPTMLDVFSSRATDKFRDRIAIGTDVFRDIGANVRSLRTAGDAFGVDENVLKQLDRFSKGMTGIEAATRLAANTEALLMKIRLAANLNMKKFAIGSAAAIGAIGIMTIGLSQLDKAAQNSNKVLRDFINSLNDVPVQKMDEFSSVSNLTTDELSDMIAEQQRYQAALNENIVFLDRAVAAWEDQAGLNSVITSFSDLANKFNIWGGGIEPATKALDENRTAMQLTIQNIGFLNSEYALQAAITNDLRLSLSDLSKFELERVRLARQSSTQLEASLQTTQDQIRSSGLAVASVFGKFMGQFDEGIQLAGRAATETTLDFEAMQEVLTRMETTVPNLTGEQVELINVLQEQITELQRLGDLKNTIKEFRDAAQAREDETAAIEKNRQALVDSRDEFNRVSEEIANLERDRMLETARAFQDTQREAQRDIKRTAADEQIIQLERRVENERFQESLAQIERDGNQRRVDLIRRFNESVAKLASGFMTSEREASEDFQAELEKDTRSHNREVLRIVRELNRDLQNFERDNNVVGFIARQQQAGDQLRDEQESLDERTRESVIAYNRDRNRAREHYEQRRQELSRANNRELQELRRATNEKLKLQRQAQRAEMTQTERLLQQARQRRAALEQRFAREDERLRIARERLDYQARLAALRAWQNEVILAIRRMQGRSRPARPSSAGPQAPQFDSGGILELSEPRLFQTGVRPGFSEAFIPFPTAQGIAPTLNKMNTTKNITVPINISIGAIGEVASPSQIKNEVEAAAKNMRTDILNAINEAVGRNT